MAATQKSQKFLLGACLAAQVLIMLAPSAKASALPSTNETESTATLTESQDDLCTESGLKKYADGRASREDIELVYQYCRAQFLEQNTPSESVKKTVDEWVGTDLSKAEPNHIFLIYELVMTAPKPKVVGEEFEHDCKQMGDNFQKYWDTMEPLTDQIDINVSGLLGDEEDEDEIDDQERELFNFVQYSQFCRSLLEDDDREADVDADDWVYKADD